MAPRSASRYGLAAHLLLGATALSSTSNHLINAPRVDAASGAPLVPSPKRFGAGVAWALPQATRRPFDAGAPRELAWWDDAPARTIFARGGIEVAEVPAPASPLAGQQKSATCPTSKAHISAVFHSFWLIFGRAIISRNGLEALMLKSERARGTLTLKRR